MAGGPVSVRSGARRGVYALVAAGLALLCVELPLRALLPDPRALAQEDGRRVLVFGYDPRAPVTERDAAGQVRFARNPPNLRRQSWSARKPEGTYRIVVVGDSTVFARLTEALSAGLRVPGRTVEVLNYGMPGAGSDRVRILWQDAVRQDPDLLLLYVGHNDWTEAAINSLSIQPFPVRAVRSAVRYSGWGRLLGRLTGRSAPPLAVALGQPVQHVVAGMLREERDAVTLPAWPEVARRFRGNVDAMCRAASGRSFAFVEQASNLLAPGKLAKEADPDGRVKEQLIRGFKALYEGNLSKADEDGWAVVSAHPDVGPGWVLLGRVAAARGNQPGALEHLRRGRELDRAGVRADSRHRAVLEAAARACGAPYVPTEDALYAQPDALSI